MHSQVQTGPQMSGEMLEMVTGTVMVTITVTIMVTTMVMVMATTGIIKVFPTVVLAMAITMEPMGKSKMVGYLKGNNR